jgi:hypothetical protein
MTMMRTAMRFVVTTLFALAASFLPARVAGASPEIDHARIDGAEVGVEDFCGLTVDIMSKGTVTTWLADGFQAEIHVLQTITNEANGHVVYVETSNRQRVDDPVDNGDGTFTQVLTFDGMNARIYTDHSNVLMRVAGFVSIAFTVDGDDNQIDEVVVTHGQYDDRDSCEVIVSAIG